MLAQTGGDLCRAIGGGMIGLSAFLLAALTLVEDQTRTPQARPTGRPAEVSEDSTGQDAQRVLVDFAACAARRGRARIDAYLAASIDSEEARRLAGRIATPNCLLGGELRFNQRLFRGAIYTALYRRDAAATPATSFQGIAPVAYIPGDPAGMSPRQRGWLGVYEFADCVTRSSPPEAHALVIAEIGSGREDEAFAALQPSFGPCLVEGVELTFSRAVLRGLVAESLYRLSAAAGAVSVAPTR